METKKEKRLVDEVVLKVRGPLQDRDDAWKILVVGLKFYKKELGPYDFTYFCEINPNAYSIEILFPNHVHKHEEHISGWLKVGVEASSKLNTKGEVESIEVDFAPLGDLSVPLKGEGLGTYIFSRFIEMVQKDLRPFRDKLPVNVVPLRLSSVDASPENGPRRNTFYRRLGWRVKVDEQGEGVAYVESLWELAPSIPPLRFKDVRGKSVDEVAEKVYSELKSAVESFKNDIKETSSSPGSIVVYLFQTFKEALFPALVFFLLPVLLPLGVLRNFMLRRRRRFG